MPTLQESLLHWSEVSQEAELVVFSTLLAIRHLHCGADSWNVGAGSDLPGDLRILGRAAAPGRRHHGSGLLLGLHEGQPAPPELHIEPPPTLLHRVPYPPGRRKDGFKEKNKIFI